MRRLLPTSTPVVTALTAAVVVLASCRDIPPGALPGPPTPLDRPEVRIALVGPGEGANAGPAARALEGARLALDEAVEDPSMPAGLAASTVITREDPRAAAEAVSELAAEQEVIAAIGWASRPERDVVAGALAAAGVPYLIVSPAGVPQDPDPGAPRLALVASDEASARVIGREIAATGPGRACMGGDGNPRGAALERRVAAALRSRGIDAEQTVHLDPDVEDPAPLAKEVNALRCDAFFWSGDGVDGAVVRIALDEQGLAAVPIVGADALRNDAFLGDTGEVGEGTLAVCPCADPEKAATNDVRAFIQRFQAKFGGPPGTYSVEGYDAGSIVVAGVRDGNLSREELATYIRGLTVFDGLERSYTFGKGGTTTKPAMTVFESRAGRWVATASGSGGDMHSE